MGTPLLWPRFCFWEMTQPMSWLRGSPGASPSHWDSLSSLETWPIITGTEKTGAIAPISDNHQNMWRYIIYDFRLDRISDVSLQEQLWESKGPLFPEIILEYLYFIFIDEGKSYQHRDSCQNTGSVTSSWDQECQDPHHPHHWHLHHRGQCQWHLQSCQDSQQSTPAIMLLRWVTK